MCGIAGIYNFTGEPVSETILNSMNQAISHRGPDGEGIYIENNVGLAHKRLAILDVTDNGKQPMHSNNKEWIISYNGCIYNFLELKKELLNAGHLFTSTSDTEVIVEGLAAYGVAFFERLNGMFAIAAYNKKTKELYLSRDRYGTKPLYYWCNDKCIVFASEIKAILKHPSYKTELDLKALNEYFTFQNIFNFNTLFKGVNMLAPANTVKVSVQSTKVIHNSWWDFDFSSPDTKMSFNDAKHETNRLLNQAVERQLVSDVKVGSYLSGGVDSGSITAIASSKINRLTTFTGGFDMSAVTGVEANYDERRTAELMASLFNTEHYEQVINAGDLKWSLPRVVWHLEDLRGGMSYPNYYISRLASKFVKVCLQGIGGDELYGGYPWRYYRVFQSLSKQQFFDNYFDFWQRLVPAEQKVNIFTCKVYSQIDKNDPKKAFERVFTFNNKQNYDTPEQHIQNSLYFECKTFLPLLLLNGDKLSMANGLEERFPFLDNDLVDFSQKVPIRHKLSDFEKIKKIDENIFSDKKQYKEFSEGKNVLRKAMADILPESIINRKKQGFSAPDESWYRGENSAYIKDLLLNKNARYLEYINLDYVKNIIHEHENKKMNHRLLIWSLMNFEWWCRLFLNNELIES